VGLKCVCDKRLGISVLFLIKYKIRAPQSNWVEAAEQWGKLELRGTELTYFVILEMA